MVDKEFYKTSEYMTFFVLSPVDIKIIRWFGSPVWENPTYNCPCEKHSVRRSTQTYLNVKHLELCLS